jgi:Ca2+-binding RTX toxin-like protein
MPIQKTDRNTTWTIDASNQTWTLAKDAKITVDGAGHGIYEDGQDGNTIRVLGDIRVEGMAYGVYVNGSNSELVVGEDSHINAKQAVSGIFSGAAGAHIVNRGLVEGDLYGIQGAIWSDVENYGTIRGEIGIGQAGDGSQICNYGRIDATQYGIASNAAGTHIENLKGAVISGDLQAIFLDGSGMAEIINRGTIRGGAAAIEGENSELTVRNAGKIVGDVYLGAGEDVLDSRKGRIDGNVDGGAGNDDYYVGASRMKIVEGSGGGSGIDEVFATASHRLAANVEVLDLIGKKNIDGAGNGGQNWIYDNKGDNILRGGGGDDRLYASGGDDTLTGNGGQDYFVFSPGGVDRITDFEDMLDLVAIDGVQTQADFDALDIRQVKGDVVIDFGGGDKVIIEDLLASNFDFNDISVN